MRVIGVRRTAAPMADVDEVYGQEEMGRVFERSDYIVNLLPWTPDTEKMIDRRSFDLMKPTACFINMGRGQTVNETDLIAALQQKKIRAMMSDVYETEPLPADSPLWALDNVIISPHVCGMTPHYMDRAMEIIDHNLKAYVRGQGEIMNVVDLTYGY
jgi:phosphoglycerate dehydrogenase-like enzyme